MPNRAAGPSPEGHLNTLRWRRRGRRKKRYFKDPREAASIHGLDLMFKLTLQDKGQIWVYDDGEFVPMGPRNGRLFSYADAYYMHVADEVPLTGHWKLVGREIFLWDEDYSAG